MEEKKLSAMDKQNIENAVEKLLREHGYDSKTATSSIDISRLATNIGFSVGVSNLLPFKDDGFTYISKDKNELAIVVNDNRTIEEKRFIVAHELAHYYLHCKDTKEDTIMHRKRHSFWKRDCGQDADYYAACILMPENSFINQYNELKNNAITNDTIIDRLQEIFNTPRRSVEKRIKELTESNKIKANN